MTDISKAVEYLKANGVDAVEGSGILIVPFDYISEFPNEFTKIVKTVEKLLNDIEYRKSWQIDPYYNTKKRLEDGTLPVGPEG